MDLSRQHDLLPERLLRDVCVTIIGVGGIGSFLALLLSKMGIPKIVVWDDDVVDSTNPSSQFYRPSDDGRLKVVALKEIVEMFSTAAVTAIPRRFTGTEKPKGIVLSAVDDMDVRMGIWHNSIKYNPHVPLYIEARMGGEELRVYSLNPCDPDLVERYEKCLYPQSRAFQQPCTGKAIAYTTFDSAGIIGREVKAFLTGEPVQFENILGLKSRMWVVQ